MTEKPAAQNSVEIEVPGTPEEVWEAIATGPGLTAWFVPAEVDGGEGGTVTTYHGVEETASREEIRAWDPPRRYVVVHADVGGKEATLATEFLVEARGGGTCIVRVVSSGFGERDWDSELASREWGWSVYLCNLRLYLTHFAGKRCAPIVVNGHVQRPLAEAWPLLTSELGLEQFEKGARVTTAPPAPPLAGVVEAVYENTIVLKIDEPAPGMALVLAFGWGNVVFTTVHSYLFGPDAPEIAAREEPKWRAWMEAHFPAAVPASTA